MRQVKKKKKKKTTFFTHIKNKYHIRKRKVTKFRLGHQTTQKLLKTNEQYYNDASLHATCILLCTQFCPYLYI